MIREGIGSERIARRPGDWNNFFGRRGSGWCSIEVVLRN
jgi:hypothetical protein